MKTILLLLLPAFSFSQDSALTFTEVVEMPGQTKEQLFIKGRQWLNDAIKSSKTALQIADKETGELSGKSYVNAPYETRPDKPTKYSITTAYYAMDFSIIVKDEKYKYIFSNFSEVDIYGNPMGFGLMTTSDTTVMRLPLMRPARVLQLYRSQKAGLITYMKELISDLKAYMIKESKSDF